ncbi:MAG: metalloregulator ArsR/SmtB family transcription factor [Oligoflexia bacterium]|nr:metalloregulator ArsR/SmtB family transcription factor [Oligoflexia bacterium]
MLAISSTYKAIADDSRLRILHILSKGSFNVQELTGILAISQSTISHHLKALQGCGLVSSRREGTWVYYSLSEIDEKNLGQKTVKLFLDLVPTLANDDSALLFRDGHAAQEVLNRRRDQARHFFESVANKWKDIRSEAQGSESFFDLVKDRVGDKATLLELGCGAGALFEKLLPRTGASIGVDYSQAMLDEAKQNLGAKARDLDLRLGYLEHLPLGDDSVDTAVAYMVMHHIAHPVDVLKDTCRVLKPGGQFLMVDLMRHSNEYMRERFADLWLGFDPEEVKRWAFSAGFASARLEVLGQKRDVFLLTLTKTEG